LKHRLINVFETRMSHETLEADSEAEDFETEDLIEMLIGSEHSGFMAQESNPVKKRSFDQSRIS